VDIHEATAGYERWLSRETSVVATALRDKHARMRADLFAFLRGTFYRWAQLCPAYAPETRGAPRVLSVGDLHVDSFGTWRDAEGRLAWGVDDFDNAYPLPYTNDLIRLATSAKIARDAGLVDIKPRDAYDTILEGYEATLRDGGRPMVLADAHERLEKLGIEVTKPPRGFFEKLRELPTARTTPRSAVHALDALLPGPVSHRRIVHREAGLGSLGQPRFTLVAMCDGGEIAREAKALIPSDCVWAFGRRGRTQPYYQRAMAHAIRSHDPFQRVVGTWIVRRLSPDSNPIELANLTGQRDEVRLLRAMGAEAANVHLGSRARTKAVLADLRRREAGWLRVAAKAMAKILEREWREYRR
jgi:Uncharacterized protein conserved in bacteria (DUF2252)